jgi:endonuclease/exonuclease/phosphatase family metal-dependent hydrolase
MAIKFVSLNMWDGGKLMNALLDFLSHEDADILLLQEVYDSPDLEIDDRYRSLSILCEQLSYPYHYFVADYLEKDCPSNNCKRGNAILSKYPLSKTESLFFDKPYSETYINSRENAHNCPRNLQFALVASPEGDIHTFNIHGVWDLDGNNFSPARRLMSNAIINAVKEKHKVVVGGDTNALPTNQAIKNIKPYLKSIFDGAIPTSFNMHHKNDPCQAPHIINTQSEPVRANLLT